MERLEYDAYGGSDAVHLRSFTLPPTGPEQLVIRVAAASINPLDWKIRNGDLKIFTGSKFPRAMGTDFSGTVESIGSTVTRFKPGDRVLGTMPPKTSGAFATFLVTSQNLVVHKPDSLSFIEAASLPVAGVTAWLALVKKARLQRGQTLFINGALGGVGQAAGAIARAIGVEPAGRVGPKSIAQAQALGIKPVLDYTKPLPESLDGAYDVVFDCNGSLSPEESKRLIKRGGIVLDINPSGSKLFRSFTSSWYKLVFGNVTAENLQEVVDLAAAQKLFVPVAKTIVLGEAPAVLAALERGERVNGKVVIEF